MNKNEKLVWKLIDRQISEQEFQELQGALLQDRELRRYYQNCLETYAVLSSHLSPKTEEIAFPKFEKENGSRLLLSCGPAGQRPSLFFAFSSHLKRTEGKLGFRRKC